MPTFLASFAIAVSGFLGRGGGRRRGRRPERRSGDG